MAGGTLVDSLRLASTKI